MEAPVSYSNPTQPFWSFTEWIESRPVTIYSQQQQQQKQQVHSASLMSSEHHRTGNFISKTSNMSCGSSWVLPTWWLSNESSTFSSLLPPGLLSLLPPSQMLSFSATLRGHSSPRPFLTLIQLFWTVECFSTFSTFTHLFIIFSSVILSSQVRTFSAIKKEKRWQKMCRTYWGGSH